METQNKVQAIYLALIEALAYAIACPTLNSEMKWFKPFFDLAAKHAGLTASPTHEPHEDHFGAVRRLLLAVADAVECDDLAEEIYSPLGDLASCLEMLCANTNTLPDGRYEARLLRFHADNYAAEQPAA